MKNVKMLVAAVTVALVASACGGDSADTSEFGLVSADTLTVCTETPYAPMEFQDPDAEGGYTGFDIELVRAIADDNGLSLTVAETGWDAMTSGLAMESGACDISVASMTITAEREEGVDFSSPYFTAEQSLFVLADTAGDSAGDLGNIGVQTGTTGEIYAQDSLSNQLVSYEGIADMYLALQAGEVDGVITDLVGNQGYADENEGVGRVVETYSTDEEYGMAVKEEGSEALLEAVNASLAKLQDDGKYEEIFDEWFSA